MATTGQVDFLRRHIGDLREQTRNTKTQAHTEHEITANRYLRALDAFEDLLDTVPVDGSLTSLFRDPVGRALGNALGFELPSPEPLTRPRSSR